MSIMEIRRFIIVRLGRTYYVRRNLSDEIEVGISRNKDGVFEGHELVFELSQRCQGGTGARTD